MADQSVRCWGANADGQLGLGNTNTIGDDEVPDATHAGVPLGAKATAVAAGGNDTCAILQDGSLRCWGLNDYGRWGSATPTRSVTTRSSARRRPR